MAHSEHNHELVSLMYTPLYVTPLFSTDHPAPSTSDTALYALTAAPPCLMEVGVRVHLHFLYASSIVLTDSPHQRPDPMSVPLGIRGWIAGERTRSGREVEYVVKNEDPHARVRRAFIRQQVAPGAAPLMRLGELVALRFPGVPMSRAPGEVGSRRYKPAPKSGRALPSAGPSTPSDSENQAQMFELPPLLPPANTDPSRTREPTRTGVVATQPYNMWETYGSDPNTVSYPTRAEADAMRNYGCPIIVGPLARNVEWQYLPVAQGLQVSEAPREFRADGWTQATQRQERRD
ncbi:uncharacterized protein TRAVEDRAFT_48368 [Trametes versicolor FP-101664 SS1]|uniref:uncharacterized protein n=1 Tax=Trametes versicolor (strain FP-101664) TaxID=717944 RepID=UPI000462167E|nr:uncharacterized protein TRAVEDRAFT_48368 [Trametes versicolor FP-101664 SS1]EIW57329.1 hypothetical protein TRAVEDRAFT_48368 [Trametes versicolor FP-101664 SS1]